MSLEGVRVGEERGTRGDGGSWGQREKQKIFFEKRHKWGKNGTKGQLFITLRIGAGGPVINWCVVNQIQQTHRHTHRTPPTQYKHKEDYCIFYVLVVNRDTSWPSSDSNLLQSKPCHATTIYLLWLLLLGEFVYFIQETAACVLYVACVYGLTQLCISGSWTLPFRVGSFRCSCGVLC